MLQSQATPPRVSRAAYPLAHPALEGRGLRLPTKTKTESAPSHPSQRDGELEEDGLACT